MSNFKPMNTAPLNGKSVLLQTNSGVVQASYHFGKWEMEKVWSKQEFREPSPKLNPTGWMSIETGE